MVAGEGALWLIGCGVAYESIAADCAAYASDADWQFRRAESVGAIAGSVDALLADLPARAKVFIAVDEDAINYARLELYLPARLRDLRLQTLVHPTAVVAPDARLADNVWVGPGASIGSCCKVGSNVLLSAGVRLDPGVQIGAHGWVGMSASIGGETTVGSNCVVGANVHLGAALSLGKHCVLTQPGTWMQSMPDNTFFEPGFSRPSVMIGLGHSWQPR
jgi:UDP-3-O-[3-hydroxymyristoyl] glucosamine N-acyltransferase